MTACGGADASRKTTPDDDREVSEDEADGDEAPRKSKKKVAADDEADEESEDDEADEESEDATPKVADDEAEGDDSDAEPEAADDEDDEEATPKKKPAKAKPKAREKIAVEAENGDQRMTRKEREREARRARDRERLRQAVEREEAATSKKKKKREPDEDDRDEGEDEDTERKPTAAEKKRAEAERKQEEAAARREEAAEKKREEAARKKELAEAKAAEAARKKEAAAQKKREDAERKAADAAAKREAAEAAKKERAAAAAKAKAKAKPTENDDEEDEDVAEDEADEADEEEDAKPVAKKPPAKPPEPKKPAPKKPVETDEDEEEEDDEVAAAPAKKPVATPDDEDEEEEDEEDDSPPIDFDKLEADDDPLAQKRVAAVAIPGMDGGDDRETDTGEAPAAVPARGPLISRPLTLAKGGLELHGGLRVNTITFPGTIDTPALSSTSQALMLGGSYGVSDKLEVGADYALSVNPGSIKGPFTLRGAFQITAGKLDLAVAGGLALDFYEEANAVTMMTTSTTYASLQLGAWVRYHATPKLTLFSGNAALPASSVGITKLALPLPPFQYQLLVGLNEAGTIALELPVGAGFQVTPSIYTYGSLNLAHIRFANTTTALAFRDFVPLSFGGFYSLKKLDIGVQLGLDAKQGTDYLRLDTVVRYSIK